MKNKNIIRVSNFNLTLDNQTILKDINFELEDKTIFCIVGPSGSGKSSFLHCLNRLIELQPCCQCEGEITYLDKPVSSFEASFLRKQIGLIQQKPSPLPFSIYENFAIPLRQHGTSNPEEITSILTNCLKRVGLWSEVKDKLKKPATQLSGGQQQRLCIARAIALNPKVLLLDEPCSALDPLSTQLLESLIIELSDSIAIVIVTHNLAQARRLKGKSMMIWSESGTGVVLEQGLTEQVLNTPNHPLAQKYVQGSIG